MVTWDSDGSSDSNGSSDDDKKSIKKALASIAINNKPSIFDTLDHHVLREASAYNSRFQDGGE